MKKQKVKTKKKAAKLEGVFWSGWAIVGKERKITGRYLDLLIQSGCLFETKPDKDDLENAIFDPKREEVVRFKLSLEKVK